MGTVGIAGGLRRGMCIVGVIAAIVALAGPTSSTSLGPFELRVGVEESPGVVRLRVYVPRDVSDADVDLEIRGRSVVVHARDRNGLSMRSREIPLSQTVSASDAEATFAPDGALVIVLHAVRDGGS
jgi:hypothetical protein